ncbi:MAG: hypothetical protein HQL44_05410 [Alphaproteobacteria bacterium]|nr:hypothetical protein [Alphaproteobacteria bacterium]
MKFSPFGSSAALLFWSGIYTLVWFNITFTTYPGFWLVDEEMAIHSLGHGAYIDNLLVAGNGHANSFFQFLHPGLPLQLCAWLAYRLTSPNPLAAAPDVFHATLLNPEPFHLATQTMGWVIVLLGLFLIWRQLRDVGLVAAFVALSLPFACQGNWSVGFWRLDSETFSLVLAAAYFGALGLALTRMPAKNWFWPGWFWLGALLGCAYLNKVSHISWFAGAAAGWLGWLWFRKASARVAAQTVGSVLIGGFVAGLVGLLIMGPRQFYQMLHLHWRIATHSGTIGEGTVGFVDAASLVLPTDPAFFLAIAILLLVCLRIWLKRGDPTWLARHAPMAAALGIAVLAGLLIILRQKSDHYFSPTAALLPMLALWLFQAWDRRIAYVLLLAPLAAIIPIKDSWHRAASRAAVAMERQAEIDEILALPLPEGQIRLWSFKVQTPHYLRRLAVEQSGIRSLSKVADLIHPQDFDFNIWNKMVRLDDGWHDQNELPWRLAIFERRYFKQISDLPKAFQDSAFTYNLRKRHIWVERHPSAQMPGLAPG